MINFFKPSSKKVLFEKGKDPFENIDTSILENSSAELAEATQKLKQHAVEAILSIRAENTQSFFKYLFNYFRQLSDPIVITNIFSEVLFLNDAACSLFEFNDTKKLKISEFLSKPSYKHFQLCIEKAKNTPVSLFQATGYTKNNKLLPLEYSISYINHDDQEIFITVFRDISSRIEYEQKLRRSEVMYRTFMEQSMDGMFILENQKFLIVNDALCKTFGYSKDELINPSFNFLTLIHPSDRELILTNHYNRINGLSAPDTYTFRGLTKKEELIYIKLTPNAVKIDDCNTWIIGTIRDVTTQMHLKNQHEIEHAYFKSLFEDSSISVCIIDSCGFIDNINNSALKLFKFSKEELQHNRFVSLVSDGAKSHLSDVLDNIINMNLTPQIDICFQSKLNDPIYTKTNFHTMTAGGVKYIVAIIIED
jgi:PAS domain S-box-containing protein